MTTKNETKHTPTLEVRKHIEGHFMITDIDGNPVAVTDTVERAETFVRAVNLLGILEERFPALFDDSGEDVNGADLVDAVAEAVRS